MNDQFLRDLVLQMRDEQVSMTQTLARIEARVEDLSGPQGRVTKLESAQSRQWWVTAAIAPFLTICAAIAKKFGVTI